MIFNFSTSTSPLDRVENRSNAMGDWEDGASTANRNRQVTPRDRWVTGFFDHSKQQEQNQKEDIASEFETSEEDLKYLEFFCDDPRMDVNIAHDKDLSKRCADEMEISDGDRQTTQPMNAIDESSSDGRRTCSCEKGKKFPKDGLEKKVGWMSSFRMAFGRSVGSGDGSGNEKSSQHSQTEDDTIESSDTSERSSSIQTDEGDPSWTLKFGKIVSESDDDCEIDAFHLSDTIVTRFADDADETGSLHSVSMSDGL